MASEIPAELRYTPSHEWVRANADGTVTVGITDFAQRALGSIVYVEVPDAGRTVGAGEACVVVESVKSASDVYSPLAGRVTEVNATLVKAAEDVNAEPYGKGWLFRLLPDDPKAMETLLDHAGYGALVQDAGA